MRPINKKAQKIFDALLAKLNDDGYAKIDTEPGTFMALSVERIGQCEAGLLYSLAHYGEQNGDLMRDPEMTFVIGSDGRVYPLSFRNDYAGHNAEAVTWGNSGEIKGVRPRMQREHAVFAGTWLRNIAMQQAL